jgi:hypothetical protein
MTPEDIAERLERRLAFYFSHNNQPCMSGDPRDRCSPLQRRNLSEAVASVIEEIQDLSAVTPKAGDNADVEEISKKAADAVGVTPYSDMRPFVVQAVKYAFVNGGSASFQDRVAAAHHALFHDDPTDVEERRARFLEEAIELAQAFGMPTEDMHALVERQRTRPAGEPEMEVGGVAVTLASLCVVAGINLSACAEEDLRILNTPEKIAHVRAKRATRHGRGPLPGFDPCTSTPVVSQNAPALEDKGGEVARLRHCLETVRANLVRLAWEENSVMIEGIDAALKQKG